MPLIKPLINGPDLSLGISPLLTLGWYRNFESNFESNFETFLPAWDFYSLDWTPMSDWLSHWVQTLPWLTLYFNDCLRRDSMFDIPPWLIDRIWTCLNQANSHKSRALGTIFHKIYEKLRNVRKTQKCTEVSEMYLKTLLYIKTVQKVWKKR